MLMRALAIPFEEHRLRLDFGAASPFRAALARVSPAGRVPVLVLDDGFAVWDTLAIAETLHEQFPAHGVWPSDARSRARARSLCAEMHSGFDALRSRCPMNIEATLATVGARLWAEQAPLRRDVSRIEAMWADALQQAGGGPFLFGAFGAADAFYAPVAMRLRGYGLPMSATAAGYVERVIAVPAVAQWMADACAEHDVIAEDDPYRSAPG
ncbi:MAG: glutathione S-transferase [Rubrivivax sp.]